METLNQDIKSGNFKRFYLLFGEEEFLKQSYKKRLRQAVAGKMCIRDSHYKEHCADASGSDQAAEQGGRGNHLHRPDSPELYSVEAA